MSETAIVEIAARVGALSTPGLLVMVLWAGYRGFWVWGRQYREMQADRDFWRSTALRLGNIAERTVQKSGEAA